jgi:hypothetical protein
MTARAAVVLLAVLPASCGAPLMKLPQGPGAPISAQDAAAALTEATAACRGVRTLTAEVAVSGSAGGQRLRGRLSAGVAAPASARLEAVAPFGPPLFIFVATGDDATLLLPRDSRVLEHSPPDAVLNAVAGVPLGAGDLRTTLTGCAPAVSQPEGKTLGADWRVLTASDGEGSSALYLHRGGSALPWQLAAVIRSAPNRASWRAEYRDYQNGLPRSIHLTGGDQHSPAAGAFDVTLTLSQVETNVALGPDAFTVQIPKMTEPISLEELRRSGPLAPRSDGH